MAYTSQMVGMLVAFAVMLQSVLGEMEFTRHPSHIRAAMGTEAALNCSVRARDTPEVTWTRNGVALTDNMRYMTTTTAKADMSGYVFVETTLVIPDLQLVDEGGYQCMMASGTISSQFAYVTVLVPPDKPSLNGETVPVLLDAPVNVTCIARNGKPQSTVTWKKDGMRITKNTFETSETQQDGKRKTTVGMLTLTATLSDAGKMLECGVWNAAMIGSPPLWTSAALDVQYAPKVTISRSEPSRILLREHDYVKFICSWDANPSDTRVRWYMNDAQLQDETSSTLVFQRIRKEYTGNVIKCEVSNAVGTSTDEYTLTIQYGPFFPKKTQTVSARIGERVKLRCDAYGSPMSRVTWQRQGSFKIVNTGVLWDIPDVIDETFGVYTCSARVPGNPVIWRTVNLIETGPRAPHIYAQPAQTDVYFRRLVRNTIKCIADGTPTPTYTWKKDGVDLNMDSDASRVFLNKDEGTLIINQADTYDEGIYQCFAKNDYGISTSVKINFRSAKLVNDGFSNTEKLSHVIEVGEALTLPCVPPQSIPWDATEVYWVVRQPNYERTRVELDKRVTMDLEGRLRFTHVLPLDQQKLGYACTTVNNYLNIQIIGGEHDITVRGDTAPKRPGYELWTSPSDHRFLKGETLRLKCIFAGNPTPDVYWSKVNGDLSDSMKKASEKSFGQELQIPYLDYADAGQYECIGNNSETGKRVSKMFYVRIEAAPYWTQEPQNAIVKKAETATFTCKADGVPEPRYTWYINGVEYDDVRDRRIFNNTRVKKTYNELTISPVSINDHFNVQCNASNIHGYIFADVYLHVMDANPITSLQMPPFITAVQSILYYFQQILPYDMSSFYVNSD